MLSGHMQSLGEDVDSVNASRYVSYNYIHMLAILKKSEILRHFFPDDKPNFRFETSRLKQLTM